jgi:hypothetical protein
MATEQIIIGKDTHTIEVKPITLIVEAGLQDIQYPERVVIDSEFSIQHYRSVEEICMLAQELTRYVLFDIGYQPSKANLELNGASLGAKQLAGMWDLFVQALKEKMQVVLRCPENNLHPRYHGNIADVMIAFSKNDPAAVMALFVAK